MPSKQPTDQSDMAVVLYRLAKLEETSTKQNEAILDKLETMTSSYMHRNDIIERDNAILEEMSEHRGELRSELTNQAKRLKALEDQHGREQAGISFANTLVSKWIQLLIIGIIGAVTFILATHRASGW